MKSHRRLDAFLILGFSTLMIGAGAYALKSGGTAPHRPFGEKIVVAH